MRRLQVLRGVCKRKIREKTSSIINVLTMRYELRNQDKIAATYSEAYLKEHIIASLDAYFRMPRSREEVEEYIYSSCVCYETKIGSLPIMQINDVADENAMVEFAWLGTQYDVIKLAFLGRMKG